MEGGIQNGLGFRRDYGVEGGLEPQKRYIKPYVRPGKHRGILGRIRDILIESSTRLADSYTCQPVTGPKAESINFLATEMIEFAKYVLGGPCVVMKKFGDNGKIIHDPIAVDMYLLDKWMQTQTRFEMVKPKT